MKMEAEQKKKPRYRKDKRGLILRFRPKIVVECSSIDSWRYLGLRLPRHIGRGESSARYPVGESNPCCQNENLES